MPVVSNFFISTILPSAAHSELPPSVSLTAESFKQLLADSNSNWRSAARALIKNPQNWSDKEELILQVLTVNNYNYEWTYGA
jgi:hypothetical protein